MFKVGDKVVLKKDWRSVKGRGNANVKWISEALEHIERDTFVVTRINENGRTIELDKSGGFTLNVKAFEHVDWLDGVPLE